MTTERDPGTRIVLSWLREDAHENAERMLRRALDEVDTTPQRRSWWPAWRSFSMNSIAKVAIAAAAVVVVAVVGISLVPGGGLGAKPTPSPTATPTPPRFPPTGPLAVGRHSMTLGGATFTFALSTPDWSSNGEWGIDKSVLSLKPQGAGFIFWDNAADGVYSKPCDGLKAPAVGPSAAALAAAITGIPGIQVVSGPTAVTVGGKPAQKVVVRIPDNPGCAPESFFLWYDDSNDGNQRYASQAGQTIRVWIIEVGGKRIQIDGETFVGAGAQVDNELQGIVDSIQFD
ncbi:MAG: hypothetical protein HYX55_07665 [Chloroflexi bacterium]|nr:hypothetical protein [Chloroflexota bacterium]